MNYTYKKPKIILIGGKAGSGKTTLATYLTQHLKKQNKKVIISPYTKYLKRYIEEITGSTINENNKPRELLQKISSDLIKKELGYKNLFINRQIEDLKIYSYFADVIIIPDVRFPSEIEKIKEEFDNVISIKIKRENYQTDLTVEQQQDITETSLDNYDKVDYIIENNKNTDLKKEALKIIKKLEERR